MKNFDLSLKKASPISLFIKTAVIEILVTVLFIIIFAAVMLFSDGAVNFAAVFATAAIALGCVAASFYAAKSIGKRGLLTGFIIGIITFCIITLISMILDSGAVTINTLFKFIIIMLSSLIGGVAGVNNGQNKKYIK